MRKESIMLPPWYEEIYPNVVEQCTNVGTGHLGLPGSMHPSFILTAFTLCPIGEQVANDFLLSFFLRFILKAPRRIFLSEKLKMRYL